MQDHTIQVITPDPAVELRVRAALGTGRPLPSGLRGMLERLVGLDLAAVRLHTGPEASWLTGLVDADAVTAGADIFFADGAYQPQTERGLTLLGHELGHVLAVATSPDGSTAPARPGLRVRTNPACERFADEVAAQVLRGQPRPPSGVAARPLLAQDELVLHCCRIH